MNIHSFFMLIYQLLRHIKNKLKHKKHSSLERVYIAKVNSAYKGNDYQI